ncbi:MAG TPA: molybdopterin-dependent oxidoreductase [Gemmatimonadaceae bacterium]|nr:molybdopterin-dependent oxidoreductase [Gemmatimonadaceae bacterium]
MSDTSAPPSGVRRREFLKVLGATGAATAAIGCTSSHVEKLIPYLVQPDNDNTVPGVSTYFATTCRECAASCGVLAEARDGRTFKLEGNPEHPLNRGALCARGQAAVQGLLNPDRYRGPRMRRGNAWANITWDEAIALLAQKLAGVQGAASVFLNRHESGAFPAFLDQWLSAHGLAPHLSYDPLLDGAVVQANLQSYGVAWPAIDFTAARLIVSFGADFLETWGASVPQQLSFADARARGAQAPRFVYIGPRRSLTGLNADTWIPCAPGSELAIARALVGNGSLDDVATQSGAPADALRALRSELESASPALFLSGANVRNAFELALAVNDLNRSHGSVGSALLPDRAIAAFEGASRDADVIDALDRMRRGQVALLFVRGVNPVHTLPAAAGVADALAKVPFKVSFSSYPDATSELCDLILPDNHPLESWGIAQPLAGEMSLQQPAMRPLFDTRATGDVLIDVAHRTAASSRFGMTSYRDWIIEQYPGGVRAFTAALEKGVAPGRVAGRMSAPRSTTAAAAATPAITPLAEGEFHLVVYPHPALGEGSGANKPWLQEMPDPVSKVSWQSWIEVHPTVAKRLDIVPGSVLRVETSAGHVDAPAFVYPGIRPDTVAIALGRGHTAYGRFAEGIGINPLTAVPVALHPGAGVLALSGAHAQVHTVDAFDELVTTEGSARQHDRGIAQVVPVTALLSREERSRLPQTVANVRMPQAENAPAEGGEEEEEYPGKPDTDFLPGLRSAVAADAQGELVSKNAKDRGMYALDHWSGMAKRRWAMTIDLARCTGCSACITACYAENNVPTVGAPYQSTRTPGYQGRPGANILRGREMTWMRVERYYEGNVEDSSFEARFVPMLCQHCGNAPCEPVCPVYATYHSPDGLNVQVYNRCVGTRYCSNNCPYKVRYFNWFGFGEANRTQYAWPEPLHLQLNPDVNVRGKGVMEKCTFCVQRIREAESRARLEGREVQPDEFTTSCAQACPSRAIIFGDAASPDWTVSHVAADERGYHVFPELNTYTAVVYLKKIVHPAPPEAPSGA